MEDNKQIIETGPVLNLQQLLEENRNLKARLLEFEQAQTELKLAQNQLTQTRAELDRERKRLQTVLEVLPIAIFISDPNGKLLQTNQEALNLWGPAPMVSSAEEYNQYKGWWPSNGKPLASEEWAMSRTLTRGERIFNEEVIIESFDGKRKTILNSAAPIYDENNQLIGGVVCEVDITTFARLRVQLEQERQHFYNLLMDIPAFISVLSGPDHRFEFINQQGLKFYGNQDILGKPLREVRPQVDEQAYLNLLDQVYQTGQPFHGKEMLLKFDRHNKGIMEQAYFNNVFQPLKDSQGQVSGVLVFAVEVTEQVQARQQLEALAAELETIIEAIPDGLFVSNTQQELTRINHTGLQMLGLSQPVAALPRQALLTTTSFTYPDNRPLEWDNLPLNQALQGKVIKGFRLKLTNQQNGQQIQLRASAAPIRNSTGKIIGAVAVDSDVTLLYQQEQEKDVFISVIAHELKTPVTSIRGFTQLVLTRLAQAGVKERELDLLNKVIKQADRLTSLINELNTINQVQQGKLHLHCQHFDLAELVRQVGAAMQITTETHPIILEIPQRLELEGDPTRLEQVLTNLVGNAIKYSPQGGSVTVSLKQGSNQALLIVSDQGIGIPAEDRPYLFERFRRASNVRNYQIGGFGLGLYISNQIVMAHGGRLWLAESKTENSQGSTFCLSLPLTEPAECDN